jgi:3-oxoacyl-[acyl-carrier protein] reductase
MRYPVFASISKRIPSEEDSDHEQTAGRQGGNRYRRSRLSGRIALRASGARAVSLWRRRPHNITVNAILVVLFPHEIAGFENMDAISAQCIALQSLNRTGTPDDLSPSVVFLASDESGWITGQAIAVNGGLIGSGG